MAEKKITEKDVDADRASVAERIGADSDRGYFGREVDPTPVENYTLQTPPDAPTPETDEKAAEAARARAAQVAGELSA